MTNTKNKFRPTHEINLTDRRDGGRKESIYVQLVDGVAYTYGEWTQETAADWTHDAETGWAFQGQAAPRAWLSVSVRTLSAAERNRRAAEARKAHEVA